MKFEERMISGKKVAHPEVMLGLTTISLIRCLAGFLVFLLAFGLRRIHADLAWYGFALGGSGLGAISGLMLVPRVRKFLSEAQILLLAVSMIALAALIAAWWAMIVGQVFLALVVGLAGALAQPSFDAMVQRYIPGPAQGRAFARFATRQQLVWVLGAICPVIIAFNMTEGDVVMAGIAGVTSVFYFTSRKALSHRPPASTRQTPIAL